ncbi:hypothetical protein J7K05_02095 [bacterium]|nr:hypothetical protein [bacterium]
MKAVVHIQISLEGISTSDVSKILGKFPKRKASGLTFPSNLFLVVLWQLTNEFPQTSSLFVDWGNTLSVETKDGEWRVRFDSCEFVIPIPPLSPKKIEQAVAEIRNRFLEIAKKECV